MIVILYAAVGCLATHARSAGIEWMIAERSTLVSTIVVLCDRRVTACGHSSAESACTCSSARARHGLSVATARNRRK